MKHYSSWLATVIVTITREPAASCRGLFIFTQFKKKIEVICQFPEKSILFILSPRPNPFPHSGRSPAANKRHQVQIWLQKERIKQLLSRTSPQKLKNAREEATLEVCEPFSPVALPNLDKNCRRSACLWFLPCERPNCCSFCSRN